MTFIAPANFSQLPPSWEMSQPFNIDAAGEVDYDTDPVLWARNHILAVVLTSPGERVMRPTYGAGVFRYVWENGDPITEQTMINDINNAVATWERNITLKTIEFVRQRDYTGVVNLKIEFSLGSSPTNYTITLGGRGVQALQALPA